MYNVIYYFIRAASFLFSRQAANVKRKKNNTYHVYLSQWKQAKRFPEMNVTEALKQRWSALILYVHTE